LDPDADLDPLVGGMDPRIRIRTKMCMDAQHWSSIIKKYKLTVFCHLLKNIALRMKGKLLNPFCDAAVCKIYRYVAAPFSAFSVFQVKVKHFLQL
jgi:hypothetical protein